MFASSNTRREIYNYNFHDKELPKGNILERLVNLTLRLFDNSKGNSAYKTIFDMSNENTFVTPNAVCANVTPTSNLESLSNLLGLTDSKFIKIYFKNNRVTASCRKHGRTFGARGTNLQEAINDLVNRVTNYQPLKS